MKSCVEESHQGTRPVDQSGHFVAAHQGIDHLAPTGVAVKEGHPRQHQTEEAHDDEPVGDPMKEREPLDHTTYSSRPGAVDKPDRLSPMARQTQRPVWTNPRPMTKPNRRRINCRTAKSLG